MSDNVLQTFQQLVQDVIAPDVRELKVRLYAFEKQVDVRFDALDKKMDARFLGMEQRCAVMNQKMEAQLKAIEAQFRSVLTAIGESRAQTGLGYFREFAALNERVAILETKRQ